MAKNIEEFLRMAAERRRRAAGGQAAGGQAAGGQAQPQGQRQPPAAPAPQRPARQNVPSRPANQPVRERVEIVEINDEVEVIDLSSQSVGSHVRSHINTSDISSRVERLGDSIEQSQQHGEARIHERFDHEIGHLDHDNISDNAEMSAQRTTADDDAPGQFALGMVEMLRSPKTIGQAILLNEILRRPNFD